MFRNDQKLSLSENTFEQMKADFDSILNRTIGNMEMKGASEATVTMKLIISLEKTTTYTDHGPLDVTRPVFKHDISSVMQVKDKKSGQLDEEMALVFDDTTGEYILRPIRDGQMTMDDIIDADYEEADYETTEYPALESPKLPPVEDDEVEDPFGANKDNTAEENRYDHLIQYAGDDLTVVRTADGYEVITEDDETVLSTSEPKGSPAYVAEALLKDLVGKTVTCVEYEVDGKTVSIAVECEEEGIVIAEASNPDEE